MRRWIAVLLLVLLPLQFSWAAVASYCGHESGAAVSHVGHHDLAEHGQAAKAPSDDGAASGVDCGHCHGHCPGIVAVAGVPALAGPARMPRSLGDARCAGHVPAEPERPKWAALA